MDDAERKQLDKLIEEFNVPNMTDAIRSSKNSGSIYNSAKHLFELKSKHKELAKSNFEEFEQICINECKFLFMNYTEIFSKLIKSDEMEFEILEQLLAKLKEIEEGKLDQHEASVHIGKLLHNIYTNKQKEENISTCRKPEKAITYKQWKKKYKN